MASMAILTSLASIFLPTYSGVRPTISPATKMARITKQQHGRTCRQPTPPTITLAELDVDQRDHAAERGERVVHRIDGAAGGGPW